MGELSSLQVNPGYHAISNHSRLAVGAGAVAISRCDSGHLPAELAEQHHIGLPVLAVEFHAPAFEVLHGVRYPVIEALVEFLGDRVAELAQPALGIPVC